MVFGKENNENEESLHNELLKRMKNSNNLENNILGLKLNNVWLNYLIFLVSSAEKNKKQYQIFAEKTNQKIVFDKGTLDKWKERKNQIINQEN